MYHKNHTCKKQQKAGLKSPPGFSLIEILVVIGIIAILAIVTVPAIQNSFETRNLDSVAREVRAGFQKAKVQAVKTKMNHRIRFLYENNIWRFIIEREESPGSWNVIPGSFDQLIPDKFNVVVNLPNQNVEYSPLGLITNYDPNQNQVQIQSPHLAQHGQPDTRSVFIYGGGSSEISGGEED